MKTKIVFQLIVILLFIFVSASVAKAENALPIVNRTLGLNEELQVTGEVRYRFEYRDQFNFNEMVNDEDAFHLIRTRINVDWQPDAMWRFFVQLQDARSLDRDGPRTALFNDENFDIRQLTVDIRDLLDGHLTIRAGRQELSYSNQRLIGGLNWTNTARSFDAIKLMFNYGDFDIDVFWSRVVGIKPGPWPNEFNSDDDFAGIYTTYHGFDKNTIEVYYFFRNTENKMFSGLVGTADQEEHTVGARASGKNLFATDLGAWDYNLEGAYQFGDFGSMDIEAYMYVGILGYTFNHDFKPRLAFEYAHGSGDNDTSDGKRGTFDNLFPTNHMYYGYMDRIGLQNIHDYHPSFSIQPTSKLKAQVDLHILYVDETTDSLYTAGLGVLRTPGIGVSVDEHVGEEIDVTLAYKFNKYLSTLIGYSHFFAGEYLSDTGRSDDGDYVYTQIAVKF